MNGVFWGLAQGRNTGEALPAAETHSILWKGEAIDFVVRRGSARRRRMAIRVTRDGGVEVLLPPRASRREAFAAVVARGDWIVRHVREIKNSPQVRPPVYAQGEEHLFFGERYRLELVLADGGDPQAEGAFLRADGRRILHLRVRSTDPQTVHKRLFLWYKAQISRCVAERLTVLCPSVPWLGDIPPWRVRVMRRRWGSCTASGVLTLNTQLVKAPPSCLDYVLLHEIAHLKEHNHSKRYYAVLDRLLPAWRDVRRELERWAPAVLA